MVEFAILLPVFVFLLLIAIDFGRMFFSYVEVSNAAREGAAFAAANPTDTAGITTHATQETNAQRQGGENPITVTTVCKDSFGTTLPGGCADAPGGSGIGNSVTVSVAERFSFLTPLIGSFFNNSFSIGTSASSAVLGLAADAGGSGTTCVTSPTAIFTYTVSGRTINLDASGSTPTSGACAISGYNWDMGDGIDLTIPIVGKTASYTYAADGVYPVTLDVSNSIADGATIQSVTIGTPGPTPTPTPTPTPVPTPTPTPLPTCNYQPNFVFQSDGKNNPTITFQGSSTGQPAVTTWSWDFTNNGTTDTTGQSVSHSYNGNPSNVTAKLTIVGPGCASVSITHKVIP